MRSGGLLADEQRRGDLGVRPPGDDVPQHLPLPLAEQPLGGQVESQVLDRVEPHVRGSRHPNDLCFQRLGAQAFGDRVCGPQRVPDLLARRVQPNQSLRQPPPAVGLLPGEPDLAVDVASVPPGIALVLGGVTPGGLRQNVRGPAAVALRLVDGGGRLPFVGPERRGQCLELLVCVSNGFGVAPVPPLLRQIGRRRCDEGDVHVSRRVPPPARRVTRPEVVEGRGGVADQQVVLDVR